MKKKLLLVGPLPSKVVDTVGGVAEFNYSIASEFNKFYDVICVTDNKLAIEGSYKLRFVSHLFPFNLIEFRKIVKSCKPDIIISALQYSFLVKGIKNCLKVHFVHGFVTKSDYSKFKYSIWKVLNKFVQKNFDYQIANSEFTKVINYKMLNNKVDYVVPLAINNKYLMPFKENKKRKIDVLYVGRIIKAKGILEIVKSLKYLPSSINLTVVGDGPDLERAKQLASKLNVNVKFVGSKKREELVSFYRNSKIFISLNEAEPFGLTYIEALSQGCNIICPIVGGQVENLIKYKRKVNFINKIDSITISKAIEISLNKHSNIDYSELKKEYSYERVIKDLVTIFEKSRGE